MMRINLLSPIVKLNNCLAVLLIIGAVAIPGVARGQGAPELQTRPPQAPPPAPPVVYGSPTEPSRDGPIYGPGQTLWSIGQPTDEEQLYLEYINRSRANPPAEGLRLATTTDPDVLSAYTYFNVDLNLMQSQFNAIAAVPPLAMSSQLMAAARLHSGDMYTNQFQGHVGSTGSTLSSRVAAQGYSYSSLGENVYSYAEGVWHGHAGFNVDWGDTVGAIGGMQNPPGHRISIHNGNMREVGIGVVNGVNGTVGPQLVTQDFGVRSSATPIITGVAYYDLNGNNFYDVGEGIGGVSVEVPGSAYYAVTADSGGYAIPVTTNGNYSVTFAATGLNQQTTALISSGKNVKVDFTPVYSPPVISGPTPAAINQPNNYSFTPVGAATGYQWQQAIVANYTAVEGAETLANVTLLVSGGYAVQDSSVKFAGTYSFHLAHPVATDQFVTLNAAVSLTSTSALSFYKRLGYAGNAQTARAQISVDGGASWQDLWTQVGSGGAGESGFSLVNIPLSAYAGSEARFRFVYDIGSGSYFNQTASGFGLYLDNIAVSNARQFFNTSVANVSSGTSFVFTPTAATNYILMVRAQINSRTLPWGPALELSATVPPPSIQLAGKPNVAGSQVQVDFTVANYQPGMTFQLWKSSTPESGWAQDGSAVLTTLLPGSQFRMTTTTGGASKGFYRVRGSY